MILVIVFLISTGISYAWFGLTASGNEDAKDITAEAGTLSLRPEVTVSSTGDGSYRNPYVVE